MVFGLSSSEPQADSPAIICHRRINYHKNKNLEATKPRERQRPAVALDHLFMVSRFRPLLIQNGEGTAIRKMIIIANAMMSLASMAPMFPSKLPHPARPASIIRLPAMTSPIIAPITGPTKRPIRPKNNPTSAPRIAPNVPHFVAPNISRRNSRREYRARTSRASAAPAQ